MGTVRGNRQVIPLEYVTVSRWNEEERRRLEGLIKKEQRNRERERGKACFCRERRRNRAHEWREDGRSRGRQEEKKGSRHPLGSREATQEANSPITCRTYRGFAIQASPSNTINIPGRMPGSMLLQRARYATAKEKTIDE